MLLKNQMEMCDRWKPKSSNQVWFSDVDKKPDTKICIAWRNLRYYESGPWFFGTKPKMILNRLNGCFEYHSLNAFIGPSGAGKTTLLNCLNGNRVKGLTPESEIYLNKDQRNGKVVSYFIEQHVERTIVGKMRVGQILRYAYRFKNGNEGDMEGHIRKTIDELLLDELVLHRNFEQCSGGEQKRVAIAQELMSLQKPTLLFVDEPTTGLDSNAAHLVMKCLRQLATNHRMAIITSIHVPSDDILTLFDKLYVLAKGGVCIYSGRPDQLRSHLETQFNDLVIPEKQPPTETLTKIACSGLTHPAVVTLAKHTLSAEYNSVSEHLLKLVFSPTGVPKHRKSFSIGNFTLQLGRMLRVAFVSDIKPLLLQISIGFVYLIFMVSLFDSRMVKPDGCYPSVWIPGDSINSTTSTEEFEYNNNSSVSGKCYNQIQNDSLIRKNVFYLGNVCLFIIFVVTCVGSVFNAPFVHMFRNEHRNQWYSLGTFFCSSTVVGVVQALLYCIPFSIGGYFLSGQYLADGRLLNWNRLGHFLFYYIILAVYFVVIGQLIGTLLYKNLESALILSTFVTINFATFSGYMIDVEWSNSILIKEIKSFTGFDTIMKGIVYTIYGLDRCNLDIEYSLALLNFHVDPDNYKLIGPNWHTVRWVLINTALIRVFTLLYLHWKFNLTGRYLFWKRSKLTTKMLPFSKDIGTIGTFIDSNNNPVSIQKRQKSEKEIEFEKFSHGKILIAWRNLSLFGTNFLLEQTDLTFKNVPAKKIILKNLNGEFRFGTLNALMGTSGAGKTSLLKVLNGRNKTRLSAQSQFYLSKFTRIQTCFITQDVSGHLLPGLTAKQMLVYASRLKNSKLRECGVDTSKIDHQQIALNLLDELGLSDTVDTLVEKCSGGEQKRLALALELTALQMPNLICIDEPTSGLDSNSAEVVVACLRKLTQTHSITIVASIHQPTTEVLLMFDQIYVLARGGVCIYSGVPKGILSHLRAVPEIVSSLDCAIPIESLIKLSCRPYSDPVIHKLMSTNRTNFDQKIIQSGLLDEQTQLVEDGIQQNRRRFSLEDTRILCLRYLAYIRAYLWKEWAVFLVIILLYTVFVVNLFDPKIATVSGCLNLEDDFNNSCTKSEASIEQENLLVYNLQYLVLAFGFLFVFILIQSILSILKESKLFFNEHRNGWYSSGSFYLTKSLFNTVPIALFLLPFVHCVNIYESTIPGIYLHILLTMLLTTIAYQGFAHLVCLLAGGNLLLTSMLAVIIFMLNVMLTNFSVTLANTHYFFRMLASGSIARYQLDSMVILLYGFGRCQPKQIQPLLYLFSLDDSDYSQGLLALVLIGIFYHTISLALLVHIATPAQNRRHQIRHINEKMEKLGPTNTIIPGLGSPNDFHIKIVRFD